jgi:hypothetical protein
MYKGEEEEGKEDERRGKEGGREWWPEGAGGRREGVE